MRKLFVTIGLYLGLGFSGVSAHDIAGLMGEDSVLDDQGRQAIQQIEKYEEIISARIKAAGEA